MDSLQNYTCSICLGLLLNPVTTKCNHHFCKICIDQFAGSQDYQKNSSCPNCRQKIGSFLSLVQNNQLQEHISKHFPQELSKRKGEQAEINRLSDFLMEIKIQYGNTHQPVEFPKESTKNPGNFNSEQWCCFVKLVGLEGKENDYISQVKFELHSTFQLPQQQVNTSPFQISQRGWGTFTIPIKIYWKNNISSPTELAWTLTFRERISFKIHTIKIDKRNL